MGGKIMVVVILVVILGGVIYVWNSGLVGKVEEQYQTLLHPSSTGQSVFTVAPPTTSQSHTNTPSTAPPPVSNATPTTAVIPGTTTTISLSQIPKGFTVNQLSPQYHEVRFDGISGATAYSYGRIYLAANMAKSVTVDVTGWQIKGNDGGEYIPQAVNIYDPSGLTAPGDIQLQAGQYVYLYSSKGPFNLRLNECIGYIGQENHLTPALPNNCPYPNRSAITSFTGACQNYISTIGQCVVPNLNNTAIPENDPACRAYIENNFNYWSCFNAHEGDANFLSNEWWVWMGASPVDPYHDTVDLLDRNGLLVDIYSY